MDEFDLTVENEDPRMALVRRLPEPLDSDLIVEVDVDLPKALASALGISDVTIEMEVDANGQTTISETAIIIENEEGEPPMTGQGDHPSPAF